MTALHTNYRSFLRDKLLEKRKKNSRFSLRAFAKNLGVDPGFLSYLLNGKRDLSESMIAQFIDRLCLQGEEAKRFEWMVRLEKAESPLQKKRLLEQLNEYFPESAQVRNLSVDHFVIISEWYHFALLELIKLKSFEWNIQNAAKTLEISPLEVDQALERMASLELISYVAGERPSLIKNQLMVQSKTPNEALKKYHTEMLEKSIIALSERVTRERITSTQNITLSEKQLAEADKIIDECFRKLIELSEKKSADAEVYHFGMHGFPLTNNKRTDRGK